MLKKILFLLLLIASSRSVMAQDKGYDVAVLAYKDTLNTVLYNVNEKGVAVGETVKLSGHYAITYQNGKTDVVSKGFDDEDSLVIGGIDSFSAIAGSSYDAKLRNFKPVRLNDNALQSIPELASFSSGTVNYVAEDGTIVGAVKQAGSKQSAAFLLNQQGLKSFKAIADGNSEAFAVNAAGVVVGSSTAQNGKTHATIWDANGQASDLGSLNFAHSRAKAINASGQIAGVMWDAAGEGGEQKDGQAFFYSNGKLQKIGTLGGLYSEAKAINDQGVVVGIAESSNKERHAFIFKEGQIKDLNEIIKRGDIKFVQANDINNAGVIVGYGFKDNKAVGIILTPKK